jgi:cytochrome c peroxidase
MILVNMALILLMLLFTACNGGGEEDGPALLPRGIQTEAQLDQRLRRDIARHNLTAYVVTTSDSNVTRLGEKLFSDINLSGNRNISCQTCHHPDMGTSDDLALSIGEGASGLGKNRFQVDGVSNVIRRNAPQLFNLGQAAQDFAFHDGRVEFDNGRITAPETIPNAALSKLDKALDVQSIFPLLSNEEMLGAAGSNDLANLSTPTEVWNGIMTQRVLNDAEYVSLFQAAFPTESSFNIGHAGHAMGEFMKDKFQVSDTPFDRYISGDSAAMSLAQKRGMLVFMGRGRCIRCHTGTNLTDNAFHSVGVPHIYTGTFKDDLGREEANGRSTNRYEFKTPGLRNISSSAPYMHNGTFESLEQVVDHYNNVPSSLFGYTVPDSIQRQYEATVLVDSDATRNNLRIQQIDVNELQTGLGLTAQEKADLVIFLRDALSN